MNFFLIGRFVKTKSQLNLSQGTYSNFFKDYRVSLCNQKRLFFGTSLHSSISSKQVETSPQEHIAGLKICSPLTNFSKKAYKEYNLVCVTKRTYSRQNMMNASQDQQLYLTRGSKASIERVFSQQDVADFANLSGDLNAIHLNPNQEGTFLYSKYNITGSVLVHGMLIASLITAIAGTKMPGKDSVYLKQTLNFEKPVYSGDLCVAKVQLTRVIRSNMFAFETTVYNKTRDWMAVSGDSIVTHPYVRGGKGPLDVLFFWFEDLPICKDIILLLGNDIHLSESIDPMLPSNSKALKNLTSITNDTNMDSPFTNNNPNDDSNAPNSEIQLPTGLMRWFSSSKSLDNFISMHFASTQQLIFESEQLLDNWMHRLMPNNPELGMLTAIILFDQFSRNIYRGTPKAFAFDSLALQLAKKAIFEKRDIYYDALSHPLLKSWILLPFEHSEKMEDQNTAVKEYSLLIDESKTLGIDPQLQENFLMYAIKHQVVIEKFGRFPHRNEILGRQSTEEEIEHLKLEGGF